MVQVVEYYPEFKPQNPLQKKKLKHREVNQLAQDLMSSKFVAGT
jgi:hypothetical protein